MTITGDHLALRPQPLDLPALEWSATRLTLPENLSLDAWTEIGRRLRMTEQSVMWWIGDWLRFGERKYGETYASAAEQTGYSVQTLRDAKWVAERYEVSDRYDDLPWSYHRAAASLPQEDRAAVLGAAAASDWSRRDIAAEVQRRRASSQLDAGRDVDVSPGSPFGYALRCLARLVAAVFDLDPASFVGEAKGGPDQVHARQVLAYLLHTEAEFDQSTIARGLGRHHSTIAHSIQVIEAMVEDPEVEAAFDKLGATYRDLRAARDRVPDLIKAMAA